MENRDILLGIDPSLINFGVCIYSPEKNTINVKTGEFIEQLGWINSNTNLNRCVAVVENPGLVSAVFKMWPIVWKVIQSYVEYQLLKLRTTLHPTEVTKQDIEGKFRIAMKYAQSVGENKAAAKIIISMLKAKNVPVLEVSPAKRDRADNAQKKANKAKVDMKSLRFPTKTSSEQFKELTGFDIRTNEHNRDAATLVVGRSIKSVLAEINRTKPNMSVGDFDREILIRRESEQMTEQEFYSNTDDLEDDNI